MTEQEAYAKWNREQRLRAKWEQKLRQISQDIETISLDMALAWAEGDLKTVYWLNANPRYRRTVDSFLNLRGYRKCMAGWKLACGSDIGLFRRTCRLGWPRLWRVLLESRKRR